MDDRIGLAILCNSLPPYRLHFYRRIGREIPEVRLRAVRTHEEDPRWSPVVPPGVELVSFGDGVWCGEQGRPRHAWREWRRGGRVVRWLQSERMRAVVLDGYNDATRLRVLWWCRRRGIPCFIFGDSNIRDDRARGVKALVKRVALRRILGWASGALACGTRGRAYFQKYGVPADRVFYCPYEPDYALIRGITPRQVREASERFDLAPGRRRLVYSGRLAPEKRVDLLIDAFAAVAAQRPEWDLVILGDGPLGPQLRDRVPDGLCPRVHWLGHVRGQTLVSAVYRASDVLVLPSDREPWALVVNEAAAAGMAVVSSDVPAAAAEIVRDGVNGRIFPTGDLAALTAALRDVTSRGRIDAMKAASPGVLDEWAARADPINGLRCALRSARVLAGRAR